MRDDIHNYCTVGIVHGMAYPHASDSPPLFLSTLEKLLVDDYFELIEIGQLPFPELNGIVPTLIKSAHCTFSYCGHSRLFKHNLNPNSLVEVERLAAVDELKRGIDEALEWGATEFQFLSRLYDEHCIPSHIEALAKSVRQLCSHAGSLPVTLEVFDHNIDKCSLLGPIDRVVSLLDKVSDIPNFGIMVDCSHIPMIGETIEENIEPIRSFVRHAHVGNTYIKDKSNPAYGDLHPRFGYPGSENDVLYVAEYLKKLLDIGYLHLGGSNALSFEVRPLPGENGDLVVANAKRTLNQAWRKVCEGSVMQSKE